MVTFQDICLNNNASFFPHIKNSRRSKQSNTTSTNSVLFCRKKSIYQDTFVKKEEVSTYQELDLSGSVYQNATRR